MGQTLNGNVDTSATNGFTPGKCDQTGPSWPAKCNVRFHHKSYPYPTLQYKADPVQG